MAKVNPYLNFNGTAEAAFNLYKNVFGGEFTQLSKFKDVPSDSILSDEDANRVMHVGLHISAETILMASDTLSSMQPVNEGNNISISVDTASEDEATRIFNGLAEGGQITMPLDKTFWGAYFGMCTDAFGINWMVNYDYPKEG
jgi:PhnB protein